MQVVSSVDQAVANIRNLQKALKASPGHPFAEQLARHRAWYAIPDNKEGYVLAPSKYIGYADMSPQAYIDNVDDLHGAITEKALQAWFVPADSKLEKDLMKKLQEFLARYGKTPSRAARISVLKDGNEDAEDVASALAVIYRSLPDAARKSFLRYIRA